jgi:beta-glucanase (GH16 family)
VFQDLFNTGTLGPQWNVSNEASVEGGGSFRPSQIDMSQTVLRMAVTQDGTTAGSVGAELELNQQFGYGTYEWVMRAASTSPTSTGVGVAKSGQISSTFQYSGGNPVPTEIDAPEIEGQFPNTVEYTTFVNGVRADFSSTTLANPEAGFHAYKYIWGPGYINFYIDNVPTFTSITNVPTQPAFPIANLWGTNSTSFGGVATVGTRYMYISSFKYWNQF